MPSETNPVSDVITAKTRDGLTLPVIDVTRPPFAVPDDAESIAHLRDHFIDWIEKQQAKSRFIGKFMLWLLARRSKLLRTLFQSEDGYLDSITTYVLKLGGDYLPEGYNSPIDRKVADTP